MKVAADAPGFQPTMVYQDFGHGENVNTFNGGLIVDHVSRIAVPENLGGLLAPRRVYNSKDASYIWIPQATDPLPPHGWMGFGWALSFGRVKLVIQTVDCSNSTQAAFLYFKQWFYVDESGAEHRLYLAATGGYDGTESWDGSPTTPTNPPPKPRTGALYVTNDGSYLRAYWSGSNSWPNDGGTWTIYYPDGSTRILGGDGTSFLAPTMQGANNSTGDMIQNWSQQGWYTTSMKDRAGNTTAVTYRPYQPSVDPVNHPYAGQQPYMGAISSITDHMEDSDPSHRRTIEFEVFTGQTEASELNGLLHSITLLNASPAETETYSYTLCSYTAPVNGVATTFQYPELSEVADPVGLDTRYNYAFPSYSVGDSIPQLLSRIDYPTGASVSYTYGMWDYFYYDNQTTVFDSDDIEGVTSRTESGAELGGSSGLNTTTWLWNHQYSQNDKLYLTGNDGQQRCVVYATTQDPLGQVTAHLFSCPLTGYDYPAGIEMGQFLYSMGNSISTDNVYSNCVYSKITDLDWGGGDAALCVDVSGPCPALQIPRGNSRTLDTVETEWAAGSKLWYKKVQNLTWDNYGHYMLTYTTGTNLPEYWVTARAYDLKYASTGPYQLDRLVVSFAGTATSAPTGGTTASATGTFRMVQQDYTDAAPFPNAGLLAYRCQMRSSVGSFSLDPASPRSAMVTPGASDPTATLAYLDSQGQNSAGGNIDSLVKTPSLGS